MTICDEGERVSTEEHVHSTPGSPGLTKIQALLFHPEVCFK